MNLEYVRPNEIEKRSFEIIESEIAERYGGRKLADGRKPVILRVIHTTADFDYLDNLVFSENVIEIAKDAIQKGAVIVTDTNMARAGINASALKKFGCEAICYMSDEDVATAAARDNITRAAASVDKAAALKKPIVYAVGNAPTALIRICEHIKTGDLSPALVIGVPVGFVNVVASKETLMAAGVPYIVARGRKGGSTVAAAIVNALLYMARDNV
ncbi:MAG: precorrin-8X methylmutase [Bacteroides sp.]|nr:precorrin-8X methylmutase [Eubacterium sp.]MCM1417843.1 precorrin-8X methylmutase [Roseburia sp.]MCM1461282.1 precorrin-8X methylmutase [Bacteroides sp.]